MNPQGPPSNSSQETLFSFLSNPDFRKIYNEMLEKTKKLQNISSNNWFLEQCLDLELFPQSFQPKLPPKNDKSQNFQYVWSQTNKEHSKELMRNVISADKIKESEVLNDVTSKLNVLIILAPNERTKAQLKSRIVSKGQQFRQFAMDKKIKKLNFLTLKQKHRQDTDSLDKDNEIQNSNDVTSACDDDDSNNIPQSKPKKIKRKHIKKTIYRRQQNKIKKQKISVVFNYSGIKLSKGAEAVLNRGLNFSILPEKLNFTQVLVDLAKFERLMEWKEFWHDKPADEPYVPPLFKKQKHNRPKNPSQSLKTFIQAVKSELQDPKNRNIARPNIPAEEMAGLKELIQLQRDRVITIKPCDKGAGIIILSFQAYMESCYKHLNSVQLQPDGTYKRYYKPVDDLNIIDEVKHNINNILQEAHENKVISDDEKEAMECDEQKGVGKFYTLYKVHKDHAAPATPPERPIISCSGSITENIGIYVDSHLKPLANTHESFLQDTPHYLRELEKLNNSGKIKNSDILVTIDVCSLYTNIDQHEGLEAVEEALEERSEKNVPTNFIISLLQIILMFNIFEFNSEYFMQVIGTAMGAVPAVSYANLFMARKIEPKILAAAQKYSTNQENPIIFLKRFLDDVIMVWRGSVENLHLYLKDLNSLHPSIKFTLSHTNPIGSTCGCPTADSIPFLDTSCSISENKILTDLYKKKTDRNQYLLTSSCHPAHVTSNIPFSLALRIVRICTLAETREKRFSELREMLLAREYCSKIINNAIDRARNIPRLKALEKVVRNKTTDRPVFVIHYDPRLPSVNNIIKKHYRSMIEDPKMKEVFPDPPLIAYRRQKNIRQYLIRAKVPPDVRRPKRKLPGMKKCNSCVYCHYIMTGDHVKFTATKYIHQITTQITCNTRNLIYLITCLKCLMQYVGETDRRLKDRFLEHQGYVRNKHLNKATGEHFNLPGHSLSDMHITALEHVQNADEAFRKVREKMYTRLGNTKLKGMNKVS